MVENRKGSRQAAERRLDEIVLHAAALETPARDSYLRQATAEEPALLAAARERLRSAAQADSTFLAGPVGRLLESSEEKCPGGAVRFPPGALLGERYRIISSLGHGGMGEVYRADDLKLGEPVALKLLLSDHEEDIAWRSRLLEEARIARRVSHPNICRVHDVGEADGHHFLTMEYIDGEDLASLLRRIGRLPQVKAREIGLEICAGLGAAHGLQILHRDLKPSNLMLDSAGRTRITDFGLAGWAGTTERRGSPAYMAPERWQGAAATVRGDIYSLGLVLYELFTGIPAFRAESIAELRRLHLESFPTPPSHWLAGFDSGLEGLILACLEKDPERRPTTVEEVAGTLERIDPGSAPNLGSSDALLQTLLSCEPMTVGAAQESYEPYERLIEGLAERHRGRTVVAAAGRLLLFERPAQAVAYALAYHAGLEALAQENGVPWSGRVAIDVAEIPLESSDLEGESPARETLSQLLSLAVAGQTLLTRGAFDLARRGLATEEDRADLSWLAHGAYQVAGSQEALEVFEVGVQGKAPLLAPEAAGGTRRSSGDQIVLGWRAAPGVEIPGRPHWVVSEKIGEGVFGDAWKVIHRKTGERRVFKFCYEARSLRSLQREITLFRLLKEELGERRDINRILDWSFEEAPYFIETEYSADGHLGEWAASRGGLREIPLATRLEIVAQVAEALAAAHSVGILHKDVKPACVLIIDSQAGVPRISLTDFGIGLIVDQGRLADAGFTVLGMTEMGGGVPTPDQGTRLYLAPELVEGQVPTVQADIYSLGVLLYQLVVGDLSRVLAPDWRLAVDDELLRDDIAAAVAGSPSARLRDAAQLAARLRSLEARRQDLETARRQRHRAERARRRWRLLGVAAVILALFASLAALQTQRSSRAAARAKGEADRASSVSRFVVDLFEATLPSEVAGNSVTARELLDRSVDRIRFASGEPLVRAELMDAIGSAYLKLGLVEQAAPLLDKALEIRQQQLDEGDPTIAASLTGLADLAAYQGRFAEAESFYQRALQIHQGADAAADTVVAEIRARLADTYARQGRSAEAEGIYRQILADREAVLGPQASDLIEPLRQIAGSLRDAGHYFAAEPPLLRALEIASASLPPDHPELAMTLVHLGDLFRSQGRYREAIEHYRRSLEIHEEVLGRQHPDLVGTLNSYGRALARRGRFEAAEAVFQRALTLSDGIADKGGGEAWFNLGELYRSRGREKEAEALLLRARELGDDYLPTGHRLVADFLLGLANLYRDQQRFDDAEPLYERAVGIRERSLPPGHLLLMEAYADYGDLLRATGREVAADELERRLELQ